MSGYGIFSDFYDSLTLNVDYESMWNFYHGLLKSCGINDGILLDLACGTGSLSRFMSKSGYDVIAVDSSIEMLSKARKKSWECDEYKDILFLCQDMRELDLYGTVKGTVCSLDSLNHLDSLEDVEKVIQKVSLFTEQGGAFVFDVNTLYKHTDVLANNIFIYDTEEVYCVWQNELHDDNSTVQINLDFFEYIDGHYERYEESFAEKAYEIDVLKVLLKKYGFEVKGVFDGFSNNPVTQLSQRAVFMTVKI